MASHKVTSGDCISSLTKKCGFHDWHTIFDDAKNARLKTNRPNANQLVVADSVSIPDKKKKVEKCATEQTHRFQVEGGPVRLRIVLMDQDDSPVADREYKLAVGSATISGKTPASGLIELDIDADAVAGQLDVKVEAPPPPAPAPAPSPPAASPPPYPPPIQATEFKDAEDTAFIGPETAAIEWQLAIGSMPSFNATLGGQDRLTNWGYDCEGESGSEGPKTKSAVSSYQKRYGMTETGSLTDIRTSIRDKHDKV